MTKIRLLLFFFLACFAVIIVRLFTIQILHPTTSSDYLSTRKLNPERGKILDTNHQPLVVNTEKYQLFVEPKKVQDKELLKIKLARALSMEEASLEARLDMDKDWLAIKSNIPRETKDTITALHIPGIGFDPMSSRSYPEGSSSAHILGFVGKNNEGDNTGYFGIEGYYEKDLAGLPGLIRSDKDLIGRPIFLGTQEKIEPENGRDLVLTIDKSVQEIIKRKLISGLELYKAKEGCVIVANPNTLEILGLTCLPDFDPDNFYSYPEEYYKNSAITNLYEPGSTFKPLIMAAGIQEGKITPNTTMQEDGPVKIGEYYIRTWNNQYAGKVTMTNVLEKSSNVGMVYVGEKLGNKKLYDWITSYGFGSETGIDLQGENGGYIKPMKDWYTIDFATATFGQGIAVTPIQMIKAFSSLINGGILYQPYVVKDMVIDGRHQETKPKKIKQIISKKTSDQIKQMLVSTIENGETKWLKPKGYQVGGKTGTAQIAIEGKYDTAKTIASFIGFSPVDNPKFVALVVLREPQSSQWGSETAAPVFFEIAKELIVYYNIAPE